LRRSHPTRVESCCGVAPSRQLGETERSSLLDAAAAVDDSHPTRTAAIQWRRLALSVRAPVTHRFRWQSNHLGQHLRERSGGLRRRPAYFRAADYSGVDARGPRARDRLPSHRTGHEPGQCMAWEAGLPALCRPHGVPHSIHAGDGAGGPQAHGGGVGAPATAVRSSGDRQPRDRAATGTRLLPLGPLRGLLEHVQRSLVAARKRPCLLAAAAGRSLRASRPEFWFCLRHPICEQHSWPPGGRTTASPFPS